MHRETQREEEGERGGYLASLTEKVIGAAIEVHQELGPGLLESAYEECLFHELRLRRIGALRQVILPLFYKGEKIGSGFRLDILVEKSLVIEVKAVTRLTEVDRAQMINYLRLSNLKVGLILNFHAYRLTEGIMRVVYNHPSSQGFDADVDVDLSL